VKKNKLTPFIAPSILSANFARLADDVTHVLNAGADWLHIDVMDNHYVPNLTFGPMICQALRDEGIDAPFDVHLMVEPVDSLIQPFARAGATLISFHPEASRHVHRTIQTIKDAGCQAGLVFNPAASLEPLNYVLADLDLVLIMSVNPGFGGQRFIPSALDKIARVRTFIDDCGLPVRLEVDGGITVDNIEQVRRAGADTFVAGSAIFGSNDYQTTITTMRQHIANGSK